VKSLPKLKKLLQITNLCTWEPRIKIGNRVEDVGNAIQNILKVMVMARCELVGHGLGQKMHEDPEMPYGKRSVNYLLKEWLSH
jgi:methionyl aminopeptidase